MRPKIVYRSIERLIWRILIVLNFLSIKCKSLWTKAIGYVQFTGRYSRNLGRYGQKVIRYVQMASSNI